MTPLPPYLLSSIDHINAALEVAVAQPPPATGTLRVCQATEDEWNAFVDSDGHIVRPNVLEWFADTGEIHIIEFADALHERDISEFTQGTSFAEQNVHRWLTGYMAAKNSQGRRWCPDLSYGPRRTTPESVLPAEYKLYDARVNPLVQLAPLPIVAPRTVIQLDGRRILVFRQGWRSR
ncbi:hypothetical protein GQ600_22585 [Phytophthora cactorum]|nr:hypothetical protein GQ600_22585 [Phytophthora cactorum]